MFGFGDAQDNYNEIQNAPEEHKAKFSHELLAGGASFAAFKAFEDHQRNEGKPVSHQFAKELLAGFAGAEVDKLAEGTGRNWVDKEEREHAHRKARENAEQMYTNHYQGGDANREGEWHPDNQAPDQIQDTFGRY
ncbi:Hypothetical protein R9X50_00673600 [Acrodontium crateriforme]|uniref:CipC-like antibiotic response protein n=1 Tax=Acrodontium crateriforme TaxID=150365 RepID=A0AAQ3RDR7_9PEZI|nr:Hypothetical protein R9X50_00673600 [Acrodontium crateriforme]